MKERLVINDEDRQPVDLPTLFARIPDDVVLSAGTRDLELTNSTQCLCGWVLREAIARTVDCDAQDVDLAARYEMFRVPRSCADRFGGEWREWNAVFGGVLLGRKRHVIETAWVDRVLAAVKRA